MSREFMRKYSKTHQCVCGRLCSVKGLKQHQNKCPVQQARWRRGAATVQRHQEQGR